MGNGFGIQAWNPHVDGPWTGTNARDWTKPDLYVDLTNSLERAGFDYILVEDTSEIDDKYRNSMEATLRLGLWAPKNDPMPLIPLMAQQTKHIGIVPTFTSTFYPPYLAARLITTLDHLTEGRVGYNLVTAAMDRAAENYGLDRLPDKELRYEMATEWVDIVTRLHASWEDGAVLNDVENAILCDHTKVHPIDYKGKYFSSRGPLNTIPGPQRKIPMAQAGNSPAGRDLTARFGDTMLGACLTIGEMKELRQDMHRRLAVHGRAPHELKLLYIVAPTVAETDEEAQARHERRKAELWSEAAIEQRLWYLDRISGIGFGTFDQNMQLGEIMSQVNDPQHLSILEKMAKGQDHKTLREFAATRGHTADFGLIGNPDTVAAKMDELMQEVGGDGFLIYLPTTRHAIAEIADGLCPALRRRGLIRDGYEHKTFRENLLAF